MSDIAAHDSRPDRIDVRILSTAMITSMAAIMPFFLVGALGVQIRASLGLSNTGLGVVLSTFFVVAAISSQPVGRKVDSRGWPGSVVWTAVMCGIALLLLGVAGVHPLVLAIALAFGGLAQAVGIPAGNLIIMREMPIRRRGLTFGIKQMAAPLGTMMAGASVPVLALTVGWRYAFVAAMAIPTALLVLVRATSGTLSRMNLDHGGLHTSAVAAPRHRPTAGLGLLSAATCLSAFAVGSLSSFLVVSAVAAGLAEGHAGWLLTVSSAGGGVVRLAAGWWMDRLDSDGFMPVIVMLALGGVGFVLLATQAIPLVIVGSVLSFMTSWGWPGLLHYAVGRANPHATGHATGIVQVGTSIGMVIGPAGFGVIADSAGFGAGWAVLAASSVMSSVIVLIASRRILGNVGGGAGVNITGTRPATPNDEDARGGGTG